MGGDAHINVSREFVGKNEEQADMIDWVGYLSLQDPGNQNRVHLTCAPEIYYAFLKEEKTDEPREKVGNQDGSARRRAISAEAAV
jgi:hypothetical protein